MSFSFFKRNRQPKEDLLATYLKEIIKNSAVLHRDAVLEEPKLGTSKIGGMPHLPAGFQWPYYEAKSYDGEYKNRPLSFLAQINLEECASYDKENLLPRHGFLYFFYEIVTQRWGFDPEDAGCSRVFYYNVSADQLQETELPEDLTEEVRVPLSVISFQTYPDLPGYEEFCEMTDISRFGENFDWDSYDLAMQAHIDIIDCDPCDVCKLLGYADLIQGPMQEDCARIAAGLSCGTPDDYKNTSAEQKAEIAADAKDWMLLAQFGMLSDAIMFGDCGCIYFYIRREDLAACRFDQVWLWLQCG